MFGHGSVCEYGRLTKEATKMRAFTGILIALGVAVILGWTLGTQFGGGATAQVIPGRYIVQFNSDLVDDVDATVADFEASYDIEVFTVYYFAIKGFSANMNEDTANAIAEDPRVLSVEADQIVTAQDWGDANCDGVVNAVDALDVLRFVVRLPFRAGIGCRHGGVSTTGLP